MSQHTDDAGREPAREAAEPAEAAEPDIRVGPDDLFRRRVGYVVRRFNQAVRTLVEEGLRPLGLTTSQYAVLAMLQRYSGSTNAQLARVLSVTPQTMTRILSGLIDSGLVERYASAHHARVRPARLTAAGEELVARAHPVVDAAEDRLFAPLDPQARAQLLDHLWTCADAVPTDTVYENF
ncbi:MarR family winged helix-turn-helix transcriptional regulator [Actinacidiphila guanduensis]|jgi:DNA-binding MarR family transcriptional regulator|uniref:DNA-binding transcriptional regulator, MarR family n=1 Tax=Actinacidiphila guanduensis TaxID=310781 RepID=A0A1G9V5Y5_9ACTN|nr:MarR family winged helix-turn-helix transcriptional regulator [Actinacidiphila guanduensis]SDM67476.1 DNA-binding transcriptional regulator, MarR family [Actinacidiphila guanduensis]